MRKLVSKICLLLLALFCTQALAEGYNDGYWPKSYFVEAGIGAMVTKGDLNNSIITAKDSLDRKVIIHPPAMEFIAMSDFSIGANIRDFTLALNYQYWKADQSLGGYPDDSHETSNRIWRLGFEFTYNLFWPDFFQIGLGGGFSFTNVKTKDAAVFEDETSTAELYGSAVAFIANLHYYITKNIAMVPSIKIYENWYRNVYTSQTDNCDLDPYLWQSFVFASVAIQYQF